MTLPVIRIYIWRALKTELFDPRNPLLRGGPRQGGPLGPHSLQNLDPERRPPEIVKDTMEMEGWEDIVSELTLTDGIAEKDDTVSVSFTEDGRRYFDYIKDSFKRFLFPLLVVTVDDRLFGPYDLESVSYKEESKHYTITGRVDREFEDTMISDFKRVFFSGGRNLTQMEILFLTTDPFRHWDALSVTVERTKQGGEKRSEVATSLFSAYVTGSMGGVKKLPGVRQILNQYAIGVSPRVIPILQSGRITLERYVDIYSKYPTYQYDIGFSRQARLQARGQVSTYPNYRRIIPPDEQVLSWMKVAFDGREIASIAITPVNKT